MNKVYVEGTTLFNILFDSWARDLSIEQIEREVKFQGYVIDTESIKLFKKLFNDIYEQGMNRIYVSLEAEQDLINILSNRNII